MLCGVFKSFNKDGLGKIHGTYNAKGVTKLCEGLKGSAITSLMCAPHPEAP